MDRVVKLQVGEAERCSTDGLLTNYFNLHLKSIVPQRDLSSLHLHLRTVLKSLSFLLHFVRVSWLNSELMPGDVCFVQMDCQRVFFFFCIYTSICLL